MAEQDNELPDYPEILFAWKNRGFGYTASEVTTDGTGTMYRKEGVSPDELDTDQSRTLLLDRIKELESANDALNDELDTQNEQMIDPALVKELIEALDKLHSSELDDLFKFIQNDGKVKAVAKRIRAALQEQT